MYSKDGYKLRVRKNTDPVCWGESPRWDLIIKTPEGKCYLIEKAFSYHGGYSQGTNRSEYGYYLNMIVYGSMASNGDGIPKMSTPYLYDRRLESIIEMFKEESLNHERFMDLLIEIPKYR